MCARARKIPALVDLVLVASWYTCVVLCISEKAERDFGFYPPVSLKSALKTTIQSFQHLKSSKPHPRAQSGLYLRTFRITEWAAAPLPLCLT